MSYAERFWSKVDIRDEDGCWEWEAGTFNVGYGAFWTGKNNEQAHRVAYKLACGDIPDGGLGVSKHIIYLIRSGKKWSHLSGIGAV